nr:brefeldin A-inhibited guanine nucleotide-exchange protein 2-like [Tanacetum cinerariifolium]GFA10387.1 brefeldin A-inhibited guanine nucleotide-exchange protein 2-like [Tanacetum cinerariifolium]
MYGPQLSVKNTMILLEAVRELANNVHIINIDVTIRSKQQELGPTTQMQDSSLLRLETKSYQICLTFVMNLGAYKAPFYEESQTENYFIDFCHDVLTSYVEIAHIYDSVAYQQPDLLVDTFRAWEKVRNGYSWAAYYYSIDFM